MIRSPHFDRFLAALRQTPRDGWRLDPDGSLLRRVGRDDDCPILAVQRLTGREWFTAKPDWALADRICQSAAWKTEDAAYDGWVRTQLLRAVGKAA